MYEDDERPVPDHKDISITVTFPRREAAGHVEQAIALMKERNQGLVDSIHVTGDPRDWKHKEYIQNVMDIQNLESIHRSLSR
jgi:hypothetical protein